MILAMQKATIFAMRRDRDALLLELQRAAIMMMIETDGCVRDEQRTATAVAVQGSDDALRFMKRYSAKSGFFEDTPVFDYDAFVQRREKSAALAATATRLETEMAVTEGEIASAKNALDQYLPWLPLEIPLNQLQNTATAAVHTGYIPASAADRLRALEEQGAYVELLDSAAGSLACLIVCHKSTDEEILALAKPLGFIEAAPPTAQATAREAYIEINAHIDELRERLTALGDNAKETGERVREVELLYDKLNADLRRQDTPFNQTDSTFYIEGWVEAVRAEELDEVIRRATGVYELIVEEASADEKPPTQTKNNKLVTPFETLTDMFSRPNPLEKIDPNPYMAPWYWLIFGMMMADAGYGLVMMIAISLFLKLKKPKGEFKKLVTVLLYASVPTIFWGIMFGSYFGAEWFPPVMVTPLYNPLLVMILCLGIGGVHICFGLGISAYYKFKTGAWQDALGNQISWIFLLLGIGLLFVPALKLVSYIALGLGGVLLLCFAKFETKNPLIRVFGGVAKLYDITGFMSDILSYSRILALMMSSGVVGMVMNMLAGMVQGSAVGWFFSLLIYLVGHIFNLAMGLLSAYVHASRLQYIEFYGKFYDGGGYAFEPLAVQPRYTEVRTGKNT